jgi:hypothetical protein
MNSIAAIRAYADARLRDRVPSAFVLPERPEMPVLQTGIPTIDAQIGGLPCAAVTELCGNPLVTSGADALLMSLLAKATQEHFCAVIDATDSFNPRRAYSAGTRLNRLLWVRCQEQPKKRSGGRLDQALHAADLLLKANCGFGVIVVDLADIPEKLLRQLTLDVWYRFRLAAEKLSTALIFSTPVPVTGTSSALVLKFDGSWGEWTSSGANTPGHARVLNGLNYSAEVMRSRDRKKNVEAARMPFCSWRSWA